MNYKLDIAYKNNVAHWGSIEREKEVSEAVEVDGKKQWKKVMKKYTVGLGFIKGKHFDFREDDRVLEVEILHAPMLQIKEVADTLRKGELVLRRRNKAIASSKAIAKKEAERKNWENLKAMKEEGKKQEALNAKSAEDISEE